jgi:hypothetical protein
MDPRFRGDESALRARSVGALKQAIFLLSWRLQAGDLLA